MTLECQLSPEMQAELAAAAEERRLSVDDLVLDLMVEYLMDKRQDPGGEQLPQTGAEAVAYWTKHGVIGAWADREDIGDNLEFARELRRRAGTRER
jgi:hypothetical protein